MIDDEIATSDNEIPLVMRNNGDGSWTRCDPETNEPYPEDHRWAKTIRVEPSPYVETVHGRALREAASANTKVD